MGEGQEQKKEEVLPGFSRCRPSSRVADPGPGAKVSHHFMLPGSKMMPLPSLKLCHHMCGPNLEPNLRPVLSSTNLSSNPEALESRGQPIQGPAEAQFLPRPRVQPSQMGLADAPLLPRPRVQPQQKGLADDPRQSRLQQMSPHLRA